MALIHYGWKCGLRQPVSEKLRRSAAAELEHQEYQYLKQIRRIDAQIARLPEAWDRAMSLPGPVEELQSRLLRGFFKLRLWVWAAARGSENLGYGAISAAESHVDETLREVIDFWCLAINSRWLHNLRKIFRNCGVALPLWLGPALERASELVELRAVLSLEEWDERLGWPKRRGEVNG